MEPLFSNSTVQYTRVLFSTSGILGNDTWYHAVVLSLLESSVSSALIFYTVSINVVFKWLLQSNLAQSARFTLLVDLSNWTPQRGRNLSENLDTVWRKLQEWRFSAVLYCSFEKDEPMSVIEGQGQGRMLIVSNDVVDHLPRCYLQLGKSNIGANLALGGRFACSSHVKRTWTLTVQNVNDQPSCKILADRLLNTTFHTRIGMLTEYLY